MVSFYQKECPPFFEKQKVSYDTGKYGKAFYLRGTIHIHHRLSLYVSVSTFHGNTTLSQCYKCRKVFSITWHHQFFKKWEFPFHFEKRVARCLEKRDYMTLKASVKHHIYEVPSSYRISWLLTCHLLLCTTKLLMGCTTPADICPLSHDSIYNRLYAPFHVKSWGPISWIRYKAIVYWTTFPCAILVKYCMHTTSCDRVRGTFCRVRSH